MNFRKVIIAFSLVSILLVVFSGCQTDTVVSDADRQAVEKAAYLGFLNANFKTIKDTTTGKYFGDSVSFAPVFWEMKPGIGDTTITAGKYVSYRFTQYNLNQDSIGKLDFSSSNRLEALPATIDIKPNTDRSTYYWGMALSMMHMKPYGKAIILLPSSYTCPYGTAPDYISKLYIVDVVFVSTN